ncbi:putative choriogenin Hminor [Rosellinia necatrix]|uniref:Putative choriogenin Hminor n=1 Tax=Rosellinia necatrix TaxID=77044 RepID=A0A1W2TPI6_ROSNE|nr:putative choriogenin Hminor [Rosellinia necatrix]
MSASKHHIPQRKPLPGAPNSLPPLPSSFEFGFGLDSAADTPEDNSMHPAELDAGFGSPQGPARLQKPAPPQYAPPPPPPRQVITPPPGLASGFNFTETKPSPRLQKQQKRRSSSVNASPRSHARAPSALVPQQGSPPPDSRVRSSSVHLATVRSSVESDNRTAAAARPGSSNGSQSPGRDSERRGRPRKSWLSGRGSRSQSTDARPQETASAWILGQNSDYNTTFLTNGEKVPELWNENGEVLVYLDAKGNNGSPSFKVPFFVTDYSLVFADLIEAEYPSSPGGRARSFTGRDSLSVSDATRRVQSPPLSPPLPDSQTGSEIRLYLPVSMSTPGHRSEADMERLISIRNMFALLTGQPLVATKSQPTLFAVLLNVSGLLKEFEYTNADGSTFGDAVEMSLSFLIEQTALADVRQSREKTLESLVLGERMRFLELYNEAFSHAVGKYPAMRDLRTPLWEQVSPSTRQRLERAHIDLVGRQHSVNNRLETFDFPALFSGVANSSSAEYRDIKFNTWRKSFGRMRQFVLNYYKSSFGSWPPKARSKKNPFTESGLNRQVLKILYSDLCALYDLLVDRESLTTRMIDQSADEISNDNQNPRGSAMRKLLGEFDQSSPPVLPPIPFDLPMLPDMASVQENFHDLSSKEQAKLMKGLQEYQIILILNKAYDFDTAKLPIPFIEQFKEFEVKESKGRTVAEMGDHRLGYWLFLYVVIQSLPMLVVDAPGLKHTEGVEYFLCQPPKGSSPWMEDAPAVRKRWYEVAGGGGLVELSEDAVEFGIEGIYHRSHCWLAAKRWEMGDFTGPPLPPNDAFSPLAAPQSVFADMDPTIPNSPSLMPRSESPLSGPPGLALRSRGASPAGRRASHRSSVALGLEPVALPLNGPGLTGSRISNAWGTPGGQRPTSALMDRSRSSGNLHGLAGSQGRGTDSRSSSRQDSAGGSTFDDILKDMGESKPKKKKGLF